MRVVSHYYKDAVGWSGFTFSVKMFTKSMYREMTEEYWIPVGTIGILWEVELSNPRMTFLITEEIIKEGLCRFDVLFDSEFSMTRNWSSETKWLPSFVVGVLFEVEL